MIADAGGRGHGSTDVWTVRCITALEAFYRKHIGDQIRKARLQQLLNRHFTVLLVNHLIPATHKHMVPW